jgi:hypothetical protein
MQMRIHAKNFCPGYMCMKLFDLSEPIGGTKMHFDRMIATVETHRGGGPDQSGRGLQCYFRA